MVVSTVRLCEGSEACRPLVLQAADACLVSPEGVLNSVLAGVCPEDPSTCSALFCFNPPQTHLEFGVSD